MIEFCLAIWVAYHARTIGKNSVLWFLIAFAFLAAISVIILAPYFLLLNLLIASLPDSLLSFTVWIGGVVVGVVMWIVLGFRVARQLIKDAESHSAGKYSLIGVQDAGPCTIEELKALLVSGKVDRETLCFRGGSPSLSVFAWPVSLRQLIDG